MKLIIQGLLIFTISFVTLIAQASPLLHCTDASRECVQSAANAYIQALLSHDASNIPLTEDATRWENGIKTAAGAKAIRNSVENDLSLKATHAIRDTRWLIDGNQAIAFYLLDVVIPYTTLHASTTRIAERFLVEKGSIKEIEVIFCNSPGTKPESREVTSSIPFSFICSRLL